MLTVPWRYVRATAIRLVIVLAAPSMATAADGNLEGLSRVKFGMSIEQVVAALGERCKLEILKDVAGREFVQRRGRCKEPNLDPDSLSADFEEATYYFDDGALSRIVLIHDGDYSLCYGNSPSPREEFLDPLFRMEAIFGHPDNGWKQAFKDFKYIFDNYDQTAQLSAATFTYDNSGRITVIQYAEYGQLEHCKSGDPIILNCPCNVRFTGIELARNTSDSLVQSDRLEKIFDLFESSRFGMETIGLRKLFDSNP